MNALDIGDLRARYGTLGVLGGVNMTVDEGEIVALLGANGAGKTTTLRAVSGIIKHSGSIKLGGAEISALPAARR